ncbi:MAG: hypothetical protein CMC08_07060 [Flavobacteriaceae bacterium]|nr:hypothetical protein [Flavobacteriaceae bacterium]|tara:strand:- start:338 stop:715 length:378 start_codon:yes stop_codon:yes gene_type:complete
MIKIEQINEREIYLFTITDDLDQHSVKQFTEFLQAKSREGTKIKLAGVIESIPGFKNFRAFMDTVKMKSRAVGLIEKYAVLSDKDWLEHIVPVADFLVPGIPIQHFELHERAAAIDWLAGTNTNN